MPPTQTTAPLIAAAALLLLLLGFVWLPTPAPLSALPPPSPRAADVVAWDGERPVTPPAPWLANCAWARVRGAPGVAANDSYTMCVREEADIVSTAIRQHGRWTDCDGLAALLQRAAGAAAPAPLFVDAGANIGACTFHVLAAVPHAHVLAAEPMAYNLWYLTRTVLAQPAERAADWRRRLRVLPLALGARKTEELAYVQAGNAGNTVLGTATEASWDNPQRVRVERLDDVLPPGTRIALLKADVQGYEMELLRGAERLLRERAVQAVQLEVATVFLNDHGTRPSELCAHLSTRGFSLFRTDGRPLGANECVSWDAVRWNSVDVVGVLQ